MKNYRSPEEMKIDAFIVTGYILGIVVCIALAGKFWTTTFCGSFRQKNSPRE